MSFSLSDTVRHTQKSCRPLEYTSLGLFIILISSSFVVVVDVFVIDVVVVVVVNFVVLSLLVGSTLSEGELLFKTHFYNQTLLNLSLNPSTP